MKKVIFTIFISIFLFFITQTNKVCAFEDYIADVERVDGLVYGNEISTGEIVVKSQNIEGTFMFSHPDRIVNSAGTISVWVTFIPKDTATYGNGVSMPVSAYVAKRNIEVIFNSPIYKRYDGTDSIVLPEYEYAGILYSDITENSIGVVGELVAKYSGSYVAEEVGVILSGISIEGPKKDCYNLVLTGHTGRIHPAYVRDVSNNVSIEFDENVYVDVLATVRVKKEADNKDVNKDYTSFMLYDFSIYDHNNEKLDVGGNYSVQLRVDKHLIETERLEIFELNKNNEYIKLDYTYNEGVMVFVIKADSQIVFTTRDVEYNIIFVLSGILVFSFVFVVFNWVKISKIGIGKGEDE